MNNPKIAAFVVAMALTTGAVTGASAARRQLRVVATLPDYAFFARRIAGDRATVQTIVRGDQDAHFIRPKPSFVDMIKHCDMLIATGLDLELWLPTVVDRAGNRRVASGQVGYVAAAQNMQLLEKPKILSRSEGGVHIYGNPHVTCSPLNMKIAARNIATGLIKNDPSGQAVYEKNLRGLLDEMDRRFFGAELVKLLGGQTLCTLTEKQRLIPFLGKHKFNDKPLADYLGGWMKRMMPLRGTAIVTYHKNWIYFLRLFGVEEAGTVEPKPGIPPSPKHVTELVEMMRKRRIGVILAANYFDEQKVRTVARRVNAQAVIVPIYIGGAEGTADYFSLVDTWVDRLVEAHAKAGRGR